MVLHAVGRAGCGARLDQENRVSIVGYIIPSVAYHEGDPQFWRANLKIYWEQNGARQQATGGARALGIKVSREHLVALMPDELREGEEVHGAGAWIAAETKRMKDANEISPDIGISDFARASLRAEYRRLPPLTSPSARSSGAASRTSSLSGASGRLHPSNS